MGKARSGWLEWSGLDESIRGMENWTQVLANDLRVYLDLSERSLTITYYHREKFQDAFEEEALKTVCEDRLGTRVPADPEFFDDPDGARKELADAQGEYLREFTLKVIDDEDLRNTLEFESDVENARVLSEEV